jgi:lactoylglutathione lyase
MQPLFRKLDCLQLRVPDVEAAIGFYCTKLGHELKWRTDTAAAFSMPDTDAELVVNMERRPAETDLLVDSVAEAIERIVEAGGRLVFGPFEIRIGQCAVVSDPWNNEMVILDSSKGKLKVDKDRKVI